MGLLERLSQRWSGQEGPFLRSESGDLCLSDLLHERPRGLDEIAPGDVVALIGDFTALSLTTFLELVDKHAIIVPLTVQTRQTHDYFFEEACVDWVIEPDVHSCRRIKPSATHPLIQSLRAANHAGLVLFSTGTTGRPKAILHDLSKFLERYETPRPTLRTLSFLLFDHIGGINTLLHTLFNKGCVVSIRDRSVSNVLRVCRDFEVEVIPTTPTFLRMMLMSGLIPDAVPDSIRLITYGTERMDQHTLSALCEALPGVDFRQTFGMSEIGIVRVKSEARDSLWMKIGGEGVETRVRDGKLYIRSASRMLGYLNAESPFDEEGWYDTKDLVETRGEYLKVVGRTTEVINVGGLKFMASEVELIALSYSSVELASAKASPNPITGQHVELQVQVSNSALFSKEVFIEYLKSTLPRHMVPARVLVGPIEVGHRHKKA